MTETESEHAIARAYREHGDLVLRRARGILRNEDDAQEVLQEVFARWWMRPRLFSGRSQLTTWLYTVTTRRCLNLLRNHNNRSELLQRNPDTLAPRAPAADPRHVQACSELLARLPRRLGQLAIYRYWDGMTVREIGEVMDLRERRVAQLLAQLRREIESSRDESVTSDPSTSPSPTDQAVLRPCPTKR